MLWLIYYFAMTIAFRLVVSGKHSFLVRLYSQSFELLIVSPVFQTSTPSIMLTSPDEFAKRCREIAQDHGLGAALRDCGINTRSFTTPSERKTGT